MKSSLSNNQLIEFDLKITDYNRLLIVCRDVLETKENKLREFECDLFNESECHHIHEFNGLGKKCTFCKFYDLLDERAQSLRFQSVFKLKHNLKNLILISFLISRISPDLYKTSSPNLSHFVQMRFKKYKYPVGSILDWCEFQPWRSPYGLVAFASCSSQAEILEAVRQFELEKERLKKSLIASKLFIDIHIKHETSEEYHNTLLTANPSNRLSKTKYVKSLQHCASKSA